MFTKPYFIIILLSLAILWSSSTIANTFGPEKGVLYLHGGNGVNIPEFTQLVVQETGKEFPNILVVTTPQAKKRDLTVVWRKVEKINQLFSKPVAQELFTTTRVQANSDEVVALIDNADAIFIEGGSAVLAPKVFLNTKALTAMKRLLSRGGVIGGASAGALAQSSFIANKLKSGRWIKQLSLGFLTNSVLSAHVAERRKEAHLAQVFETKTYHFEGRAFDTKEILGIGLDEKTAIIVKHDKLTVIGKGKVYIYDPLRVISSGKKQYQILKHGQQFDLKTRQQLL